MTSENVDPLDYYGCVDETTHTNPAAMCGSTTPGNVRCRRCGGVGFLPPDHLEPCPDCTPENVDGPT